MPRHKHDDLFARIASFNALRLAAMKAVKGKRKKPGASSFFANLERELLRLERQLRNGSYRGRLRALRDQWRAGAATKADVEARIGAWIAHAAHADTFWLRQAVFEDGWFEPVPGIR